MAKNEPDWAGFMNELVGFVMFSAGSGRSSFCDVSSLSSFSMSPKPPRLNGDALDLSFATSLFKVWLFASSSAFMDVCPKVDWPNAGVAAKGEEVPKAEVAPKALVGFAAGFSEDVDAAPNPKAVLD